VRRNPEIGMKIHTTNTAEENANPTTSIQEPLVAEFFANGETIVNASQLSVLSEAKHCHRVLDPALFVNLSYGY
jgi:hypothetical protein